MFNDGSIRDWQRHTLQFTAGKNFVGSGSFGPWLVTKDEIPNVDHLVLETRLNGEVVQREGLDDLLFKIPDLIEYISTFTELLPGDVIATGTPGGVGAFRVPPLWMKAGDLVEVEVSAIGVLRNRIAAEQ
ncbi:Ureidoglycolate lyase [compost metagenome]